MASKVMKRRLPDLLLEQNLVTEEQLRDPNKKTLGEILHDTLNFIKTSPNRTIAGANPDFDFIAKRLETNYSQFSIYLHGIYVANNDGKIVFFKSMRLIGKKGFFDIPLLTLGAISNVKLSKIFQK